MQPETPKQDFISPKLHRQILIYFLILLIGTGIVLFHLIVKREPFSYPLSGLVVGILIGFLTGRIYKIQWDDQTQQVVNKIDIIGAIIYAAYMIFVLFKKDLIGLVAFGEVVTTTSFAVLVGVMVGRLFGVRKHIHQEMKKHFQNISEKIK